MTGMLLAALCFYLPLILSTILLWINSLFIMITDGSRRMKPAGQPAEQHSLIMWLEILSTILFVGAFLKPMVLMQHLSYERIHSWIERIDE